MIADIHKYIEVLFCPLPSVSVAGGRVFRRGKRILRRVLRPTAHFWSSGLRVGVTVCFSWTSLVLPLAQARAQDRSPSSRYQHNEFATTPEDSAYFSPQRLRERMGKMEDWIQNQNARLAHLQGRGDFGASEEFSDQVRRYSVERFFVQGEMNDELEAKRAQTSRQLAQAGGFRFKQYKDGKREWFKNGKVQRVENEKIVQNGRELRRETLDMTYDARGNLAGYRTETRDETGRVMGTSRWEGVYSAGRRQDARLLSFTENSWDALGNATRLDRTNIKWTDDGKKTLSYTDKETDAYGQVTQRDVSDSTYNSDGLITSYKEVSLSSTGETSTKIWSDGTYEKNATDEWSLQSYKETVKDANGLQTAKEWGQAKYDDKGRLASFTEKNTSTSGKTSTRQWEKGRYDDQGQLTSYQEKVTDETGRTSFRGWEGGRYDENGRLVSYEERAVDRDGAASWRSWENGEYNAKNEMIGFTERSIDARGQPNVRVWQGKGYERGLLTHSNETNTDQRGRTSTKDWAGVYGEKDRLASFVETAIDVAGQTSSRAQDGLTYDALGRMTNYNETNLDSFGVESRQVWTASSFDEEDRVTSYESREITAAGEQLRRRKNISHTESGRIAGYDEELEVPGAGGTPLLTLSHWSDAVYSPMGDLLSYRESTTNPVGETSSHLWSARYDSLGRTVSYVDERIGAAGPPVTVSWSASAFDAFDHATALTETMETDGAARVRTWSGAYDNRGLVMNSLETVRAPDGQTVATHLTFAAYDKKGRLTDSSTRVRRSDMPDLISETQVAGQTYDDAGRVTGGSDVTHLTGRTPRGAIDVTITGGTANSSVANGKLTGFEQTKIILGTDDRGQAVHIQDVTAVTLGQHGDRTDVTHHMAFNAQNQVVANKTTTNRQTQTVQDAQGRTLTATQATFDNGTPEAVTTAQIKNTYGATGDIALSIEDATDALGVRTVRTNESLGTDAAGRTSANRTTLTRPGMTVTEEVTEQSQMTYDALGRSSTAHEDFTTTGPGLFTYSSLDRTITYDGSGNVRMTRETGERNGAEFENILTNNAFDISGRATAYHEQGWSADGGMTDTRRTDIHYNKYGQTNSYKDEGIVGGQYRLNIHTALERDAYGRETKSLEEGMNEGGRYRYETRTPSYNSLGQAIQRSESGWRASEGNYSQTQTNIRYDVAGRQLEYDQTKTLESKTMVSHWASKGYDSQGASLGYIETGSITAGEGVGQVYTDEQAVGATNRLGQAVSYVTISAKTYTDGSTQTSTVNWSNGAYDNAGRLDGFFEDTTTVSVDANGTTKTARNARERHHTTRYDGAVAPNTDGGTAINGFTCGYTETLYKDGDPSKAERVEVTKMVYDQNGLFYESNTLRGKTDRFKDALRGLSSMLFGNEGLLSKTGQALARLFALTEGLMERVGNWFGEAVAGGRDMVNRLLGLPTGSPTDNKSDRISAATLSTLTDALRKEIGTNQLYALPENLRPAVQSFGAMDEAPLLTRRTATVYDAQGRAMNWKEYSLTAASPAKPIYSEVNVTYKGTSSQLASYDAKTIEGEKVLHTYRDQFTHDDQGRESYREVNFEGEDIKLLPSLEEGEAIPSDNSSDGILSGWSHLTSDQRSTLIDNIYNEDVEVLGKVDFFIPDLTEYDATGAIENQFTTHVTRGIELFSLVDQFDLAQEAQQAEADTALAIEAENKARLGAQNKIINNINGKITQDEENIVASQGAVDKQNDILEKAISEEKSTQDQMDALKGQVGDITFKIDAYIGKELSRALISVGKPPVGFVSPGRVSSREFYDNKIRMKETIFFGWYSVVQINSAGQFVESVVCAEKKVLSSFSSNKNGKWSWNEVSQSSKDISSKDINILFSINHDEKANTFLWNKLAKHFLSIRKVDISSPVFKALTNLYSDRIKTNANIEKLKPELKSKSETTQKELSVFNAIYGSLQTLQSQLEADNGSLIIAQNDLETLITYLANDKALKMAEARAETDRLVQVLSGNLGANGVLADGRTINFSVSDWETLLKGETVTQGGKQWDRDAFSANTFGKRSLNSEEHTARLSMNRAGQTQTLAWKGTMTLDGQVVDGKNSGLLKQIATLAENASSQGPPNPTASLPGLSFNGDGHLSVTPPPTQTLDGFGRLTSQTRKTYSVSRWNGETAATVVTQSMKDFRYDTQGHVIGYDRVTSEPGKNSTREVLESATYDAQGRQRASVTRIIDESGSYKIQMSNDGYDANGRPLNTQRVKTQGTSVTVSKEIGIPLIDEWGHTLFGASENLSTTVDNWSNKPDFNKAVGQRSKGYTWNTAFNANGDVIDSFRIAQKAFGQEGSHLVYESTHSTYKPASAGREAGRLATSVSKVLEVGRDAKTGATLFKSYSDENTVTKYSANGQALFQTTVHSENGVTTKTEDNAARIYDGSGRLTETSTTMTDPSGQKTQNHYKATAFDQAGRATAFERSSGRDGVTTFSEKVSGAVYDVNGNLVGQDAKISEWDEDGKEVKNSTKTERGNTYNLFGQLTKSVSATTHIDSHGVTITDTKETKYAFDLSGRVVKTTVNGQEIKNGAIKPYNSIQEILSWDKNGRAARTRNSSVLDGVTTEKISLQDIQYDSKGRVISGRDLVHKTGGKLSQYTEDAMDVSAFDSWGRAAKYTQSLVDGGLRTQSSISLTYDADGLVTSQTTNVLETSINALVNHHVERTITQTGMKYDALGNLVDYKKEVKEGDLVSTFNPLLLEYDQFGRPTTALERVTDTTGRDDIVGQVGSKYNSLGQIIESPGQSVTVKGTSKVLDDLGNLEKVVAGIKAGAFRVDHDTEGKRLVETLGFTGVWVNQTTEPIGYDLQGRANKTYTVMNKVGWGTIDVPVTEVLFDQTVDRQDGHKYAASLEQRKQELQARGLDVTGTTFVWEGNTKKHRYCRATITYNKKVDVVISTQEVSNVDVKVFDALNRPLVQTVGTSLGGNTTTNNQFLTYNSKGQVAAINSTVTEVGKNADGGQLNRTYSQKQTFTYNTLGQSTQESTQTWGDSQAPLKITTSVVGDIKYGVKGERLGWEESTSTNDSTVTDVRRMSGAAYDGLGRLSTYTAVSYERIGGVDKLKYVDHHVVNTYDNKGRLSRSVSRRDWGNKMDLTVLSAEEAKIAADAADKTGQPGGGVAGLDEGWTSGSAVVVTTYQYSANGTSISGMKVTAEGTGTNTNGEVQAQGIHLSYTQSNIKYDSVGRATSYHLKTTQIEHYDYYTQVQKGLKRKNARKSVTEAVTTESDVQVLEFDGFGRQVHTVVESNRSDKGKTWTQTDTRVKSFDEYGRAKDVDRQTQSRVTVVKKKGSLGMKIAAIATMCVAPILGAAMLASTSLGGQNIYSNSHTVSQNQYKADGTLDEVATKAKTTTLEENTYQQGKNFGDKTMQVVDIAVAVGAVVAAVVLAIIPGTQALAAFCIAAATATYAVARRGISTHDLGMFGENHDRAEAKQNAMAFYSSVASICVAGAGAWMNSTNPGTWTTMATVAKTGEQIKVLTDTARYTLMAVSVAGQLGSAAAGGADAKTLWTVGALSVTSGLMTGGVSAGDSGATMTYAQGAVAISGALAQNIGMTYGKESQRTTWMLTGSMAQGASQGATGTAVYAGLRSYLVDLYARKSDGSGLADTDRLRRGMVVQAAGELMGTVMSVMSAGFKEAWSTGKQGDTITATRVFGAIKEGLSAPWKALSAGAQGSMLALGAFGDFAMKGMKTRPMTGAENQLRNTNPKLNIEYGNNAERGVAPAVEAPTTDMKRDINGKDETIPGDTLDVIKSMPGADTILKSIPTGKERRSPTSTEKPVEQKAPESLYEKLTPLFKMDPGHPLLLPKGMNPLKVQGYIVGELYASAKDVLGLWDGEVVSSSENTPTKDEPPMLLASARMAPDGVTVQREPVKPVEAPKQAVTVNTKETKIQKVLEFNPELSVVAPAASKGFWSTIKSKTAAYVDDVKNVAGFVTGGIVDGFNFIGDKASEGIQVVRSKGVTFGNEATVVGAEVYNVAKEKTTALVNYGQEKKEKAVGAVKETLHDAQAFTQDKVTAYGGNVSASWKEMKHQTNPMTQQKLAIGMVASLFSGDIWDSNLPVTFDKRGPAVITINGILNTRDDARALRNSVMDFFGIKDATMILNDTHGKGLQDGIQVFFHEYLGVIDAPAIQAARAIRQGINEKGEVFVVAHSQGTAIFGAALTLLSTEEKSKIHYLGLGAEKYISGKAEGMADAKNVRNMGDIVPVLGNGARVSNWLVPSEWSRKMVTEWTNIDRNVPGNRHGFDQFYKQEVKTWIKERGYAR